MGEKIVFFTMFSQQVWESGSSLRSVKINSVSFGGKSDIWGKYLPRANATQEKCLRSYKWEYFYDRLLQKSSTLGNSLGYLIYSLIFLI